MKKCPYCKHKITNPHCSETCGEPECIREHGRKLNRQWYQKLSKAERRVRDQKHYIRSIKIVVKKVKKEEASGDMNEKIIHPINLQRLTGTKLLKAFDKILKGGV